MVPIIAGIGNQIPHVFPVYHVPAFPSVRSFSNQTSAAIRRNWVPLFERFGIKVAFEHHDHAYKRTVPIREEAIDPERGIVYFGDGAWGAVYVVDRLIARIDGKSVCREGSSNDLIG